MKKTRNYLLTSQETMKFLKISDSTLRRWKKNGIIPYYKIEGKHLYKLSDLYQLLNSKKVK